MGSQTSLDKQTSELVSGLRITCYYDHNEISIDDQYHNISSNDFLNFDLIAKAGNVGLLIERTTQKRDNSEKTKIMKGDPSGLGKDIAKVKEWRFIYFETSKKLIYQRREAPEGIFGETVWGRASNMPEKFYNTNKAPTFNRQDEGRN